MAKRRTTLAKTIVAMAARIAITAQRLAASSTRSRFVSIVVLSPVRVSRLSHGARCPHWRPASIIGSVLRPSGKGPTMHPGEIYAKTESGVRELQERKLNLPIALRSLLIMIDGNRTIADVLERARALGVDADAVAAL